MLGRKEKRIRHLEDCCDRFAAEKSEAVQKANKLEAELGRAHLAMDILDPVMEVVLEVAPRLRELGYDRELAERQERRREQSEVVKGLAGDVFRREEERLAAQGQGTMRHGSRRSAG